MRLRLAAAALAIAVAAFGVASLRGSAADDADDRQAPRHGSRPKVIAAEDMQRAEEACSGLRLLPRQGNVEDLAEFFTDDAVPNYPAGVFVGKESIRKHLYLNVGSVQDRRSRPRRQPPLQPHEHPAGGASRPGRQDGEGPLARVRHVRQLRRRCHLGRRRVRDTYAKVDGVWKITSSTTTPVSARRTRPAGFRPQRRPPLARAAAPVAAPQRSSAHPPDRERKHRRCERLPRRLRSRRSTYGNPEQRLRRLRPASRVHYGTRHSRRRHAWNTDAATPSKRSGAMLRRDRAQRCCVERAGHREPAAHLRLLPRPRACGTRPPTCSPTTARSRWRSRACTSARSACASSSACSGPHGLMRRLAQRSHPAAAHRRRRAQTATTARARSRELAMTGKVGGAGRLERRHLREHAS